MKQIHISPNDYHKLKFDVSKLPDVATAGPVSASILSAARNPLKFLLDKKREETGAMQWGSLVDALWTTPELFSSLYVVLPTDAPQRPTDVMLNAAKPSSQSIARQQWWASFDSNIKGRQTVTSEEYENAQSAISMLTQHDLARSIHAESQKQVALYGDSPVLPGTKAKCLMDLLPMSGPFSDAVVDLKTTNEIEERDTIYTIWKFDYIVKLAYYQILSEAAGLGPRPRAVIIWQRSSYPWDVCVRELDQKQVEIARVVAINRVLSLTKMSQNLLHKWYDVELKTTTLPDWVMNALISS